MKLYYSPGACSLSPHIVALEAAIPLELEKVDLKTHKTETGADFTAINPKGSVPALKLDDGTLLTEGPAIVQYLADQKPASKLAPANGTVPRYQLQAWLGYINSELHKNFTPLFAQPSDEVKADAKKKLAARFAYVEGELANRQYLMGADFTVADAYLFVMLSWAQHLALDMKAYANLASYRRRIGARPQVQAALKAEGLL